MSFGITTCVCVCVCVCVDSLLLHFLPYFMVFVCLHLKNLHWLIVCIIYIIHLLNNRKEKWIRLFVTHSLIECFAFFQKQLYSMCPWSSAQSHSDGRLWNPCETLVLNLFDICVAFFDCLCPHRYSCRLLSKAVYQNITFCQLMADGFISSCFNSYLSKINLLSGQFNSKCFLCTWKNPYTKPNLSEVFPILPLKRLQFF